MLNRRHFIRATGLGLAATAFGAAAARARAQAAAGPAIVRAGADRPNILVHIADDLSWAHLSCAGEKAIQTPHIDRIAAEGVRFTQAFCSSPSCTPSRASLLSGRNFWELEGGANLWGAMPEKFAVYTSQLAQAGYLVGRAKKGYGPGKAAGWKDWGDDPAGPGVEFGKIVQESKAQGKPFCYWYGSNEPHRGYSKGSGVKGGIKLADVRLPPFWPDAEEVRSDVADYLGEVRTFDNQLGGLLKTLEAAGTLDNTIVVVLGDNGMPFPRCKTQLYDYGVRCPMIVRWPRAIKAGRVVDDLAIYPDLAPTFLEAAGLKPAAGMSARSLLSVLTSEKSGQVDPARDAAFVGREEHGRGMGPYPMRAVRTSTHLYIRNFDPGAWPRLHKSTDDGPTKQYMDAHKDDPQVKPLWELAYGQRPAEELYDLKADPFQVKNIAGDPAAATVQAALSQRLTARLKETSDPRLEGRWPGK